MGMVKDGRADSWATSTGGGSPPATYGTWSDLLAYVSSIGALDSVYAQSCRALGGGSGGSWMFWQPEFGTLA